jgi:hypothetical protein
MSFGILEGAFGSVFWAVRCDSDSCGSLACGGGEGEEEQKLFARELARREGWQIGTTEVPVDLCPKHTVVERNYTPLFDAAGYPLNPLLPRVGSDGRPLRSKKP